MGLANTGTEAGIAVSSGAGLSPDDSNAIGGAIGTVIETIGGLLQPAPQVTVNTAAIKAEERKRLMTMAAVAGVVILVIWKLKKKR